MPNIIYDTDRERYRALLRESYAEIENVGQFVDELRGVSKLVYENPGEIDYLDVLQEEVIRWLDAHYPMVKRRR